MREGGFFLPNPCSSLCLSGSSGVGRTGVFIAVDILSRCVEENNMYSEVDVFSLCHTIMTCRPNIIQSEVRVLFQLPPLKCISYVIYLIPFEARRCFSIASFEMYFLLVIYLIPFVTRMSLVDDQKVKVFSAVSVLSHV